MGVQSLSYWTSREVPIIPVLKMRKLRLDLILKTKTVALIDGHLFTTISVSGMTMCYACNKSITAKEALICPSKFFGP